MSSMEDLLFYTITDGKEMIPLSQFISVRQQHIYTSSVTLSTVLAFHGPCEHTQTHSTTPYFNQITLGSAMLSHNRNPEYLHLTEESSLKSV